MKIAQFVTSFPSGNHKNNEKIYGSSRVAYDLSINLAKRNHKIDVFSASDTWTDKVESHKNMTIHRYGTNVKIFSTHISSGMFYKPSKHDTDIVHVHFDIPPGPFAGLAFAKKTETPLVVTYHGDWDESYGSFFRKKGVAFFNKNLVDKLLTQADRIISPSENYIVESRFLKKYQQKTVVIPNGVDKRQFDISRSKEECRQMLNLPTNSKLILFLGAINLRKGPDILLSSFAYILKEIKDANLIFVGGGNFTSELKSLTKKMGLEKNVHFTGFIDEDLKPYYYKAADVFVLPSTISTEVFPLVLLEAMASNIPIVTSDLFTFKSIIHDGKNGLLSRKGDANDLSEKIVAVLENSDLQTKLCKNALNDIEKYSWEKISEETELLYNELI